MIPELILKIHRGLPTKRQTTASIWTWYMESPFVEDISPRRRNQILRTGKMFSDYLKTKPVDSITLNDWTGWWAFRIAYYNGTPYEGRCRSKNGIPSAKTLEQERITYHQVIYKAYASGLISEPIKIPPVPKKKLGFNRKPSRPSATFTQAEYSKYRKALNDYVEYHESRNNRAHAYFAHALRASLWTMRHSGARVMETLTITHDQIRTRKIKTTDGSIHHPFAILITATKSQNHYDRMIILTHTGTEHLKQFIEYKRAAGFTTNGDDYVFALWRTRTKHLNPNQVWKYFRQILRTVQLDIVGDESNTTPATLRMLRRYYIIRQLDCGVDPDQLAHQTGHSPFVLRKYYDSVMIERYAQSVYEGSWYPTDG